MKSVSTRHHSTKALPFLFFTEVWERLGFYVVQGLLVLYMTQAKGFSDQQSYTLMGVFTALSFLTPLLGGYLADNITGHKAAVIIGAIFLGIGYATFALPWVHAFYLALAIIIIGNGFYKPNIIVLVSEIYLTDHNEKTGFGTFYLSINLGIVLAGLISGEIRNHYGWEAAFLLASASLVLSLCTFGYAYFIAAVKLPRVTLPLANRKFLRVSWIIFYSIVAIFVLSFLLRIDVPAEWLLTVAAILLVTCFLILSFKHEREHHKRLFALALLVIASVVFWALSLQIFFCLNIFVHRVVDRDWFGFHLQTTGFYALVSVFIIFLWPINQWVGKQLSKKNCQFTPVFRVFLCTFILGLGFLILTLGTHYYSDNNTVNPLWIIFAYFCFAQSEILLLPIGLSPSLSLTSPDLSELAKLMWFLALGFGGVFAGWLAKRSDVPKSMVGTIKEIALYHKTFFDFTCLAMGISFFLLICYLILRKDLK